MPCYLPLDPPWQPPHSAVPHWWRGRRRPRRIGWWRWWRARSCRRTASPETHRTHSWGHGGSVTRHHHPGLISLLTPHISLLASLGDVIYVSFSFLPWNHKQTTSISISKQGVKGRKAKKRGRGIGGAGEGEQRRKQASGLLYTSDQKRDMDDKKRNQKGG